ncbi:signal recognition particle subunit srp68 [Sparganum proliferum]
MVSAVEEGKGFNIPVLYIIKSAQNQHGLRHGDYQHYQQYGTRSKVVPKKITAEMITDARFFILAIFEIERSWAFAMQLKAEANSEPRKRFQMISRLRKASKRAHYLYELMAGVPLCDAQTKLELSAYIHWIRGILYFELQDWVKARELLEASQNIYSGLASSVDEDLKAVYTGRINELLPQIRYCAYSIGDQSAATELREMRNVAVEGSDLLAEYQLDELLKQMQAMQAVSVTEVVWMGTTIPIKQEKARLAVLAVQEADKELKKVGSSHTKATLCESTLKTLVEAITSLRDEIRSVSSVDTASAMAPKSLQKNRGLEKLPRLQRLYTYLQYLKLSKTIWRTLYQLEVLMSAVTPENRHISLGLVTSGYHKPHELARLYDTVVQNLQEVSSLPGSIQENHDVKALLKAKTTAYKSLRCYYLALAYLQGKNFLESSSLLTRCQAQANQAIKDLAVLDDISEETEAEAAPGHPRSVLRQLMRDLVVQADAEILVCKAGYMLDLAGCGTAGDADNNELAASESALKEPLIKALDEYLPEKAMLHKLATSQSPLVPFPPEFEAVPVKPVFFDLAFNHITFPPRPKVTESSSGITGFVRGLLWGAGSQSKA